MAAYCRKCFAELGEDEKICPVCGEKMGVENKPHQLPVYTILHGRYLLGESIGEGGFGITYVGYDLMLKAKVAVKEYYPVGIVSRSQTKNVLPTDQQNRALFDGGKAKFMDEAQILAQFIDDPNIVNARDFFEENNTAYIVMEFLEGKSLKQILAAQGKMSMDKALEMLLPLMEALQKVHEHGLIHRDISPANIMQLNDGRIKLLDFGAARQYMDNEKSLSIILKPGYAPEEQYNKKGSQGPWTDVYALCATIYRMITGQTPENSVNRIFEDTLKKPSELGAVIDKHQEAVLMKGLALKSGDRYQSIEELRSAFEEKSEEKKKKPWGLLAVIPAAVAALLAWAIFAGPLSPATALQENFVTDAVQSPEITTVAAIEPSPSPTPSPIPSPRPTPSPEPVEILYSGEVGNNGITWELNSQGVLEIKGSGRMLDYNNSTRKAPWLQYSDEIKKVLISGEVTNISEYGFYGCTELTEVSISDTVTMIGMRAFSDCTSLESIVIPDSVVDVGGASFYNCTSLAEISLGNSVLKIRGYAFFGCSAFDHITLPGCLLGIEDYAFYGCSGLTSIFYNGYPNGWDLVQIGDGNYPIKDVRIGTLKP